MRVALTGGIGSGKSYVCRRLEARGIRVYDCDAAAKRLMRESEPLKDALCAAVGEEVCEPVTAADGTVFRQLRKAVLSHFLLASEANARIINEIVHPAVAADFMCSGYDWLESAIYFDSGFDRRVAVDRVVCVSAPLETRIRRVMTRDGISREKTLEWIARQLPQEEVARRSDYVLVNDGIQDVDGQIDRMLASLQGK